jgi:hypothetical protein
MEGGCHCDPSTHATRPISDLHADKKQVATAHTNSSIRSPRRESGTPANKVEFVLIERQPHSIVWRFRITNHTPNEIMVESITPNEPGIPYLAASDEWQFLKDGKWQNIHILGDVGYYKYPLKPGRSIKFFAGLDVPLREYGLSQHTLVRLKNGEYFSEPFPLKRRATDPKEFEAEQ